MRNPIIYHRDFLDKLISTRAGEIKLGEKIRTLHNLAELTDSKAQFVLIGIPEDVGVKANFGIPGTASAWNSVLKSLVNIQSTVDLEGSEILILGHLDLNTECSRANDLKPENLDHLRELRELVNIIDGHVFELLRLVFEAGKVPILIGGGHNNAFPILKAFSTQLKTPVNTINIDAHADFRLEEGRHSGNSFSYAFQRNFLHKYAVIGLQENYNAEQMILKMRTHKDRISLAFFDDLVRENSSYDRDFQSALNFTKGNCGLEIDMDSIAGQLSSAMSPSGFTLNQVREMIAMTRTNKISYLHICEAAAKLEDKEDPLCGKSICFLISDFIKAQKKWAAD